MRITRIMKFCIFFVVIAVISTAVLSFVACKKVVDEPESEDFIPEDPLSFRIKAITPGSYPVNTDSSLSASFAYSGSIANGVQGFYTNADREFYALVNTDMSLVHTLESTDELNVRDIANKDGISYAHDTLDVFIKTQDNKMYYSGNSSTSARMNTTRLGYYYYETHIRDLGFGERISEDSFQQEVSSTTEVKIDAGWAVNQMSQPVYDKGGVTFKAVDTYDPYCFITNLDTEGAESDYLEVTINSTGTTTSAELFISTTSGKGFNGEQRIGFAIKSNAKDNTYRLDLSGIKSQKEGIVGLRFDFGQTIGDSFTIKSIKLIGRKTSSLGYKVDKIFHFYSDKVHQEYRLFDNKKSSGIKEFDSFGVELKIPLQNVIEYKISYDGSGNPEYIAASVQYAGVIGFIIPNDGRTYSVTAESEGDFLVIRQSVAYNKRDLVVGSRIYNDESNSFDGIAEQARIERNPLTQISVESNKKTGTRYVQYDPLRGSYHFTLNGSEFNAAYKAKNEYFSSDITITNDTSEERSLYVWMNSRTGALEGAAVVDSQGILQPIQPQVCKNFAGEKEEPFYDPTDTGYGDSFVPLKIASGQTIEYTLHHIYQNWGVFPLKQISSIQFHISYYHLSTGVTESNCIAPYFVYGKDLWTLPDFRGCSGIMWTSQPQYNSIGRLRFVSFYKDSLYVKSEYTDSYIRSSGNTYADMDYNYISDCGSFKYSLRHLEFPQNDENRTYYTMDLQFLKDLKVEDVKNTFTLFSFDGRSENFDYVGYSNKNGEAVNKRTKKTDGSFELINIGNKAPYFTYYGLNNPNTGVMNFAYIMIDYDIVIGGKKWNGDFAFRNSFTGNLNYGELSLMEDTVSFKKGDHIVINFILLPWGKGTDTNDANVQAVRQDSVFNNLKLSAICGTEVKDTFLPGIKADNNLAEFTVSGGRNRFTVRIDGMTSIAGIKIEEKVGSSWSPYVTNVEAYDGYQITYNEDGTYSYFFVFEMDDVGSARTFKVTAK